MCGPGAGLCGGGAGFISCVSGGGAFFARCGGNVTVQNQAALAFAAASSAAFAAAFISATCAGGPLNLAVSTGSAAGVCFGVKVQTPSGVGFTGGPVGRRLASYCPHKFVLWSALLPGWLPGVPVYGTGGMRPLWSVLLPGWLPGVPRYPAGGMRPAPDLDRGGGLAGGPVYAPGGALAGDPVGGWGIGN